ncbi:MAG: DUF4263 domain-containing protein [Myxococcales bacterium]|nr:DUF4263 domain-containing protein [Myxococcales bacterium]
MTTVTPITWPYPVSQKRIIHANCDVFIDFDWVTVTGHAQGTLKGFQDLSLAVKAYALELGKTALILLSVRTDVPFHWQQTETHSIAVVNVHDFRRSANTYDRSAPFFLSTFSKMLVPLPGLHGVTIASRASELIAALQVGLENGGQTLLEALTRGGVRTTIALLDSAVDALSRSADATDLETLSQTLKAESAEFIADLAVAARRRSTILQFESELALKRWKEREWQAFFKANAWILGHGTDYLFGEFAVEGEAVVRSPSVGRTGGRNVDFLLGSVGAISFTRLVEIKCPEAPLLGEEYRTGIWSLGKDVIGGISQTLAYRRNWEERCAKGEGHHTAVTVRPQGVLIVGELNTLQSIDGGAESFEEFRRCQHGVTILCYDELLERARRMGSAS